MPSSIDGPQGRPLQDSKIARLDDFRPAPERDAPSAKRSLCWSGIGTLDLDDPKPEAINLAFCCRALSRLARFNGLAKKNVSVAQHLLLCEFLLDDVVATDYPRFPHCGAGGNWNFAFLKREVLLHDFAEAFVGDLINPIKSRAALKEFREIEDRILAVMRERWNPIRIGADTFTLKEAVPEIVPKIDALALSVEVTLSMPSAGFSHFAAVIPSFAPIGNPALLEAGRRIFRLSPKKAERRLLEACALAGFSE